MRRGLVTVLILALAVALVAVACGDDDEGGAATTAAGPKGTIGVSFPTIQGPTIRSCDDWGCSRSPLRSTSETATIGRTFRR